MDGSHPLSETFVATCAKALTFTWISRFGVPETITSNRGPQFTSDLWLQLCEMLNISHKQTTAYHPESNGIVERLHRLLKDALRARATAETWFEE
jgi:transposase InsO family protein